MTVGAGVWLGHRQIDATLTGRPGSGGRPLSALALAQKHPLADLPASELSVSRRKPELTPGSLVPFWMPFQIPPGHVPEVRPNGKLAMSR